VNFDGIAPVVRIFLRYFGATLATKAGVSIDVTDPDIVNVITMVVGASCSAASETWYYIAKKRGWRC